MTDKPLRENIAAEALEYVFGKIPLEDWQKVIDGGCTPPLPLEHHAREMRSHLDRALARGEVPLLLAEPFTPLPIGRYACEAGDWDVVYRATQMESYARENMTRVAAELETPQIHRPEAPGWYWLIGPGEPRCVQVFDNDGHGLRVVDYDGESYDLMDPFLMLFRWYGPIQPPERRLTSTETE